MFSSHAHIAGNSTTIDKMGQPKTIISIDIGYNQAMLAKLFRSRLFHPPEGESDHHRYITPLERRVNAFFSPFDSFISHQKVASILLFTCAIFALIWANSGWEEHYRAFVELPIMIIFGKLSLSTSLQELVNNGLLVLFFFVLGLEIKRAMIVGDLASPSRARLVILAALGGMLVPALIFLLFNYGTDNAHAWGIPIATDTAFALGILLILGNRIPKALTTFLVALAIVDDIGAVIIIALFYTGDLHIDYLTLSIGLFGLLLLFNLAGLRNPLLYILIGIIIWWSIEKAGLHASIAGVLVAFTIPARPKLGPKAFIEKVRRLIYHFEASQQKKIVLEDQVQHEILQAVEAYAKQANTPLQRWGSIAEQPVILFVLPIFALVNAGVTINSATVTTIFHAPLGLGIMLALILGKFIGVAGMVLIASRFGWGSLPSGISLRHVIGIGLCCGMGFTMSIFIADLSFSGSDNEQLAMAKISIMIASVIAGTLSFLWLRYASTHDLKNA